MTKGLELSEKYFQEVGLPAIRLQFGDRFSHMAFGLAGEGSDCFGFDDEISRDHDWGAGFQIWITEEDRQNFGEALQKCYDALPAEGYPLRRTSPQGQNRVGVVSIERFFYQYLGVYQPPEEPIRWLSIPEEGLALVTNGKVFRDEAGIFTKVREGFLRGYPRDVRLKRLAACTAKAARAGQYQYPRCKQRGDEVAAMMALNDFMHNTLQACYLLAGRYMPYFKWQWRGLETIDLPGGISQKDFLALTRPGDRQKEIEKICAALAGELRSRGFSRTSSDFLQDHSPQIFEQIRDEQLRQLHLLIG